MVLHQELLIDSIRKYISAEFAGRIVGAFGRKGEQWLNDLPQILEKTTNSWSLKLQPPFQPLSYNYVAPAVDAGGTPVVLKAGLPGREFSDEIDALRHFNGQGMVQLLKADPETGVMLLERIEPGERLIEIKDDRLATSIFSSVMCRTLKATPTKHNFPGVADWAKGFARLREKFGGKTGPFPESVVERAETLMAELISSASDEVLLHGDLHHWNILSAEREPWLVLDPQGVVGEPEYEVGAWLRNPFPQILKISNSRKFIARRVDQLVDELSFNRERIMGWAYSQAVLAGVWSFEEGSDDFTGWLAWSEKTSKVL